MRYVFLMAAAGLIAGGAAFLSSPKDPLAHSRQVLAEGDRVSAEADREIRKVLPDSKAAFAAYLAEK